MNMTVYWAIDDIAEQARVGLTAAWKIVSQPGFPKRRYYYEGAHPRWVAEEVAEWLKQREAA